MPSRATSSPLRGRTVLITAGPTREHLDPIRFLTNASSGKMGYALAAAARARRARVVLVSGPCAAEPPRGVRLVPVVSAEDMRRAVLAALPKADVVVAAAAVGDWRFPKVSSRKLKKTGGALVVKLVPTPDILAEVGRRRGSRRRPVLVGFALETHRPLEHARGKLRRKGLDMIVANGPETLAGAKARVTLLDRAGTAEALRPMAKPEVAAAILDRVEALL